MTFQWLKRYTPRSLYGRAALILLLPIVMIQLLLSIIFIQRLYEDVTEQMTQNVLLEVSYLLRLVDEADTLAVAQAVTDPLEVPLAIDLVVPAQGPREDTRVFYDLSGRVVIETLRRGLPQIRGIDLASDDNRVLLMADTRHGPAVLEFSRRRVSARNPHQLLVLMVGISVIMTVIAALFLRNQLRPIKRLAAAAGAFGRGQVVAYRPSGSTEVRAAGTAFLEMRNRIERQIEQRTLMLSGVSHDLRTPLTRLKLGLSFLPEDEDTRAMQRDVSEMEYMLDGFLDFMRGDALDDPDVVEAQAFVREVVDKAAAGGSAVSLVAQEGEGEMRLRKMAVQRAMLNLIGNAARYGSRAEVQSHLTDKTLCVTVEDDGPGIPADRREEAVKPFTRLDGARNQDRGTGVGLGLAITADIARRHGGLLRLSDSERLGGLKAELVLPR